MMKDRNEFLIVMNFNNLFWFLFIVIDCAFCRFVFNLTFCISLSLNLILRDSSGF